MSESILFFFLLLFSTSFSLSLSHFFLSSFSNIVKTTGCKLQSDPLSHSFKYRNIYLQEREREEEEGKKEGRKEKRKRETDMKKIKPMRKKAVFDVSFLHPHKVNQILRICFKSVCESMTFQVYDVWSLWNDLLTTKKDHYQYQEKILWPQINNHSSLKLNSNIQNEITLWPVERKKEKEGKRSDLPVQKKSQSIVMTGFESESRLFLPLNNSWLYCLCVTACWYKVPTNTKCIKGYLHALRQSGQTFGSGVQGNEEKERGKKKNLKEEDLQKAQKRRRQRSTKEKENENSHQRKKIC